MRSSNKRHSHKRSCSSQLQVQSEVKEEKMEMISQLTGWETMKLLQESQKKHDYQIIYDKINPQAEKSISFTQQQNRNAQESNIPMMKEFKNQKNCEFDVFPNRTFEVNLFNVECYDYKKLEVYLPIKNRLKYQRNIHKYANKKINHGHSSYNDLLNFNIDEISIKISEVSA